MADKKKTNKKKLSTLVAQQVPEFVLTDHPKFTEFLSSYFLFMESAELNLDTFTDIDQILLETETTTESYVLLEQTNKNGLDKGNKLVQEENTFGGSFLKNETITGTTSGATSNVLAEDITLNSRLFVSANNAWITGETVTGSTSGATAKVAKYRANPVENLQQLLNYSDPDHTINDFLSQMKEEFLNTIPKDTHSSVDTRKLIKNIKSLYRAKGTSKAHKAFFRILFNEPSEVYLPADDMLRVSAGGWSTQTFIRCTQTAAQAVNNPLFLVGQTISQSNNPASTTVNAASAIVENVTKFQEGSIVVIEIAVNNETVTGTFVTGEELTGTSYDDPDIEIKVTVSQGLSTTTVTNDGSTLTVGDEATSSGGAGTGGRVQVLDISGAGVDEVIVNVAGTGYDIGDTITFSSGTAEAKVSVVNGGFAPEAGSLAVHIELESGTITGSGSGDLELENIFNPEGYVAGGDIKSAKFLDSSSHETDTEIRVELENEVGEILLEEHDSQTAETSFLLNQSSTSNTPYEFYADDHVVLETFNVAFDRYFGDKIVQENTTVEQFEFTLEKSTLTNEGGNIALENEVGNLVNEVQNTDTGGITDIRMIAGGSGYTSLPTATITIGDRHIGLENATNERRLSFVGQLEDGPFFIRQEQLDSFGNIDNILNEDDSLTVIEDTDKAGDGRLDLEDGGNILSESFDGDGATVIPFGADIGRATSFNIVEHGIDYTSNPTLAFPHYAVLKTVSGTITVDSTFTTDISGATGTVVGYTYPLLKYTATTSALEIGDTVTFSDDPTAVVAKSDPLTGTTAIDTKITTAGKYINQDGHISELTKKVQDSLYYQDFSYVIKVSESINKWRDSLKRAVHPSGFYVTGEVNIQTQLDGQVKQPVGATLTSGLFSGTSDSPIYMRLNTLFGTIFGRRTGVGLKSMSNAIQLDGKTLRTRAAANAGYSVDVSNAFTSSHYTAGQKDVNLSPETTIELEKRNRRSFYKLNNNPFNLENETGFLLAEQGDGYIVDEHGYTVRDIAVSNGYAYGGPSVRNLSTYAFSAFAANNAITLEGGTGEGEIRLENESGVLQHPQSDSWSTTIADWNTLRFSGTLNSNVDGETMRISDINGTNSSQDHKIGWGFPTEILKFKTGGVILEGTDSNSANAGDAVITETETGGTQVEFENPSE